MFFLLLNDIISFVDAQARKKRKDHGGNGSKQFREGKTWHRAVVVLERDYLL